MGAAPSPNVSTSIDHDADGPADFREIYRRHHRLVWWVVRSAGVPEAWIEDVVHDAFLTIHRRLPELDDPAQLRPRVIGIARNAAFSHRRGAARRRARQAAELAPEEPSAVDSIVAHRQAWDQVRRFLDELDGEQREAFVLCELQGMAPAEVADALQVSRNTVYSRLRLARTKLLDHFSERPPAALPELLRNASRQGRPTREHQQRTWAALAMQLPLGGPVAASVAGGWLAAGKAALVSVGLAAATLGVIGTVGRIGRTSEPSGVTPAATRHGATVSSTSSSVSSESLSPAAATSSAPTPAWPPAASSLPPSSTAVGGSVARRVAASPSAAPLEPSRPPSLDDDIGLLQRAAQQLEQGEPTEALATLEDHARAHPESVLAPERIGLRVRALCAVGSTEQARTIAARYVAEHPGTRLAASLATPCEQRGGPERVRPGPAADGAQNP
jgi:RNA polymerase sigma-70 factor (ECF subfamily)